MTENKKFPKPRKLRNTAKQSILVLGQPDFLFREKTVKETLITINGKKRSIGKIGDDIHLALEEMAKCSENKITRTSKTVRAPVTSICGFESVSVQKHKGDTMIVVPAPDESLLMTKVSLLKELLESKGAIMQERCNWVCVVDKGKVKVSNEEILEKEKIAKITSPTETKVTKPSKSWYGIVKDPSIKGMSEKTRSLRDIALKAMSEAK